MKNDTKIRLHLSKKLFESLTKQVLAESKGDMSGGAYTEVVKEKKSNTAKYGAALPTKSKPGETAAEKKSPEIKKANKERTMEEGDKMDKGVGDFLNKLKTLPKEKLAKLKDFYDKHISPDSVKPDGFNYGKHAKLTSNAPMRHFREREEMEE